MPKISKYLKMPLIDRIMGFLRNKPFMNTNEICRAVNGIPEDKGNAFCKRLLCVDLPANGGNRCTEAGCKYKRYTIRYTLKKLLKAGRIKDKLHRFWDTGAKGKATDFFHHYYIDETKFKEHCLKQKIDYYLQSNPQQKNTLLEFI